MNNSFGKNITFLSLKDTIKLILHIFFVLNFNNIYAANGSSDSLYVKLQNTKSEEEKIDIYLKLLELNKPDSSKLGEYKVFKDKIIQFAKQRNKPELSLEAEYLYGLILMNNKDFDKSIELFYNNLEIARELEITDAIAKGLWCLGKAMYNQGKFSEAMIFYKKANQHKIDNPLLKTEILIGLTGVNYILGDLKNATLNCFTVLKLSEKYSLDKPKMRSLNNIASILKKQGNHGKAIEYYYQSLELAEKLNNKEVQLVVNFNLGSMLMVQGKLENAEIKFKDALKIAEELDIKKRIYFANEYLGQLHIKSADYEQSKAYFEKALIIAQQMNHNPNIASAYNGIALSKTYLGETDALVFFNKALEICETSDAKIFEHEIKTALSIYYTKKNQPEKAINLLQDALIELKRANKFDELKETLLLLSDNYKAIKNYDKAYNYLSEYKEVSDSLDKKTNSDYLLTKSLEFEFAKEKKEIEEKNQKEKIKQEQIIANQRIENITIFSLSSLVIIIFIVSIFFLKQKQKLKTEELESLRAQTELNRFKNIVEGEEKERQRLARELHDGINGNLTALKYKVVSIKNNAKIESQINDTINYIDETIHQVRHISHDLVPPSTFELKLNAAIESFCNHISKGSNLDIKCLFYGQELQLETIKETAIFRIIQELVTNVVKHAKAEKCLVQLIYHPLKIDITIEDDGIGYDTTSQKHGLGLQNIIYRLSILNATHSITSSSIGTTTNFVVNLVDDTQIELNSENFINKIKSYFNFKSREIFNP